MPATPVTSRNSLLAWTSLLLFLTARPAAAQANLHREMAEVAKEIKKLLDGRSEDSIAVGAFTGPVRLESSSGPAIAKVLADELQRMGVAVKRRANCEVKGDYVDVVDGRSDRLAARIKTRVLDRGGKVLVELDRGVFGDATVPALLGLTARLPANGDEKERDALLRQAIDKPRTSISGGRIAAAAKSPYGIEILVAPQSQGQYQARTPRDDEGMAYVPIRRGEVYAVRLINDSDCEAAVNLSVDGLSMFTFSDLKDAKTGRARYSVILVPAKGSTVVKGWHRTNDVSEEFVVTQYSKSAAAELKSTASLGTITACFSACWPRGGEPPADEPKNPSEFSRGGDATGRGAKIEIKFQEVERNFGVVRDTISVRYSR